MKNNPKKNLVSSVGTDVFFGLGGGGGLGLLG